MQRLGDTSRRILWAGGMLCGLAALFWLAVIAVLPWVISSAEMRLAVEKALSGDGKLAVSITGEPELQMLPTPRLVLYDVRLPVDEQQSIHAGTVLSRLDLWSLLFGQIEVAEVVLERPVLVLSGQIRMDELLAPVLAMAPRAPALKVIDGTIAWRAPNGYTRTLLGQLNGRIESTLSGNGISVSSRFRWRDAPVEASLSIDDLPGFLEGQSSGVNARLSGEGAIVRFRGQAGYDGMLSARGDLSADADSLRKVMEWMHLAVPTQGGFGQMGVTSQLVLEKGSVSLTNTRLSLDGNKVDGGFLVNMTGPKTRIQGTAAADELNLRPYDRIQLTVNNGQDWNPTPLNLNLLDSFDLDLRFSAGQVSTGTATFTTVAGSAVLDEGKLVLAIGQTSGWGGMLRGTATLSPRWSGASLNQRGLSMQVEAECTNITLEQALGDLVDFTRFEGMGSLSFRLQGEGRSIAGIAQDLSGTLNLSSNGGYLSGFDVARVLRRIERRPLTGSTDPHGGRTPFQKLQTKAEIRNGIAALNMLELSGNQVQLSMVGRISIKTRMLDLHGLASLRPSGEQPAEAKRIDLPFMIQGPWTAPRIMADPISLIERSGAAQQLLEAVRHQREATEASSLVEHLIGPPAPPPGTPAPPLLAPRNLAPEILR